MIRTWRKDFFWAMLIQSRWTATCLQSVSKPSTLSQYECQLLRLGLSENWVPQNQLDFHGLSHHFPHAALIHGCLMLFGFDRKVTSSTAHVWTPPFSSWAATRKRAIAPVDCWTLCWYLRDEQRVCLDGYGMGEWLMGMGQ